MTISSVLSRASAAFLAVMGLALLFGSDAILPLVVPGFPVASAWLGQLLAAAWLAMAVLNWYSRAARLGGIYGRPVVSANVVVFVISALSLARIQVDVSVPRALWFVTVPMVLLAIAYAALMLRGPFDAVDSK